MNGDARRQQIVQLLANSQEPIPGTRLSQCLNVSRQIIVQDIALLRANGTEILSTNKGYVLSTKSSSKSRVFKVFHSDEAVVDELHTIVDLGGKVDDVFVYHKVYGVITAEMNLKSRRDIQCYLHDLSSGKSSLLKNVTSGYHYHTVTADSEEILDMIQASLQEKGFLAKLQDYEPVDFWADRNKSE